LKSPFHGDLLRRLSVPIERIEVIFDTYDWHLPRQVAKDWKALENVLALATCNLLSFFRQNHPTTDLEFTSPDLPSLHGYFSTHKSEAAARTALSASLDAFAVYLGYFSFLIAICQFGIDPQSSQPSWYKRLNRGDSHIHPDWLKLLSDSPIVDFNRERIGVVADVAQCRWLHLAKYMMKASVPIWFYWGKDPYYVTYLESWIRDEYYLGDGDPITVLPTDVAGRVLPAVIPNSGQRPGESMDQFFSRQRQRHEQLKEKETDKQRSSREAREKFQSSYPIPGKKGASVFYWDDVDGFRIRTPLPRSQVDRMWDRWKSTEKVYNGFANCWDCCSLFGDDEPDDSDSEDDLFPTVPMTDPQPPPTAPDQGSPPSRIIQSVEQSTPDTSSSRGSFQQPSPVDVPIPTVQDVAAVDVPTATVQEEAADSLISTLTLPTPADRGVLPQEDKFAENIETEDLFDASSNDVLAVNAFHCVDFTSSRAQTVDDLLYYRFGFSLNEHPYSGAPSIMTVEFKSWQEVVRAVGGQNMQFSGVNEKAIMDFLGCLLSTRNPLQDVPGKYWDLSSRGADPLSQSTTQFIRIEKREFKDQTRCLLHPLGLHPSRDVSWILAVDAMTALECVRRGLGPHTLDIANFFIDHGIAFSTLDHLRPSCKVPKPDPQRAVRLLGQRPKGYTFNLADYAAYVTLRDAYLLSRPHARAALCVGGIVARLAREQMANVVALSGPSEAALDGEQRVLTGGGDLLCDDEISEDVMDFICGVYEVETGHKGVIFHFMFNVK
jgi:hypothetical protein